MVAIVSGNNLGLSLTSLAALGQRGTAGSASQGRNGEGAYVNVANGNLVLQDQDDRLVGRGLDVAAVRTYNSQGLLTDDNADNWSLGMFSQQMKLTGTVLTAGSSLTRTDKDGAQSIYAYDATRNLYVSTDGAGAYDTISYDAGNSRFVWTDGGTGQVEYYENSAQGKLLSSVDTNGNATTYAYNANGTLASIASSSGETVYFDYAGTNLSDLRVVASGGVTTTRTYYSYDASGRLATVTTDLSPADNSIADGKKYVTTYAYDGSSKRIASITQSDGTSLSFTYVQVGADYRVASVTDAAGQVTSYTYDTANRRTTVTDPLGLVTAYTYDAAGQLTQITGPAVGGVSQVRSFAYNTRGDVVQIVDGEGQTISMDYDASGNQVLQRDAAGNTVTRVYDARNQLIAETVYAAADPDGAGAAQPATPLTTRYVYDAAGQNRLRFVLSAEGRVTEYRYNSYGQRITSIQYSGAAYDVSGLGVATVPAESTLVTWAAAQNKVLTSRSDLAYDFRGQLQSSTTYAKVDASGSGVLDGSQSVTQYVYNQAGQLLQTIAGDGGVTAYTYDGLGRVLSTQNALTQTTLTSYDDANRKTTVALASGLIQTSTFDAAGRLISVLQTNSASANLGTSQYFYDADGRLRMTQDATGVRAWMLYDEAGRKVADIDGNGSLTEYVYNKNNQVTQTIAYATAVNVATLVNGSGQPTNPTLASIRPTANAQDRKGWSAYDAAGRLVKTVDAQGAVTENVYDGASRVVSTIRYATLIATSGLGSAPTVASIAPATNAADRVTRSFYDADGKLRATLDAEGYLTELRYNAVGQLSSRVAYATATNASYRAAGTLAQLIPATHSADQVTTLLLNGKGQVAGEIDAEGYLTEKVYDAKGNLTQSIRYASKVSAAALAALSPATTLANVRPASAAEDRATNYSYDTLGRLTQETSPEGVVTQYTYDTAGNLSRTVRAAGSGEARTVNARYDLQGRLTGELTGEGSALLTGSQTQAEIDAIWAQCGLTHTYDAASRRTSTTDQYGNKTLFFYDADGRLTHSVNALGEVAEKQYDTLGQLTAVVKYGNRISLAGLTGSNAGGLVNATLTSAINAVRDAALDSKSTYTYNTTGTLASSSDALAYAISSIYNAFGEETSRTQAIEAGRTLVQTRSYDRRGLQTSAVADTGSIYALSSAVYDAFGRLISSTDARGNVRQQSYDRLGRTVVTVDPLNASRTSAYDAFGRVLTQTDALGKVTSYAYSKSARSVAITTPENITITTISNRHGQTQSVTDGRGSVTSYSYDKNGNLVSTGTALTTTTNQYDRANRLVQTTDANGNAVQITYDAANRVLTRKVDPTGLNLVTTYQYDAKGQQIAVTDPRGALTQFEYDLKGQLVRQVVDPSGLNLVTLYSYDGRGKTLTVTSPAGNIVQYVYDNLGRRTQERTDPSGLNLTRSYAYDKNGNVTSATDANGKVTRYAYDANDRLIYTQDPMGGLRRNDYDAEGRIVKTTAYVNTVTTGLPAVPTVAASAADLIEHRVYDTNGRLKATVNSLGEVVKYTYDGNNNVTERVAYATRINMAAWTPGTVPAVTIDAAHDARLRTVYDQLNRALYTIDGAGAVVAQQYDGNGNVTERVAYSTTIAATTPATEAGIAAAVVAKPANDMRVRMVYDRANRLTWSADGVGAVTEQVYAANGSVIKKIQYANPIGAGGLPSSVASSNADRITAYVYDAANRQQYNIDSLGGLQQLIYDKNGNLTQSISSANAIAAPTASSTHSVTGTAAEITARNLADPVNAANDRVTRYAYDKANRLTISIDAEGAASDTSYDAAGNVVQIRRLFAKPNNISALSATATDADVRPLLAANDANDRIERKTYDAAGRLVYSVNGMGYVSNTGYDGVGRLASTTRYDQPISLGTPNTTADVAVALTSTANDRTDSFVYDTAGRLVSSTDALGYTESYTYNGLGNKLSFTNKMGAVWTYDYDAAGHLVKETSPQVALTTLAIVTDESGNLIVSDLTVNEAASGSASIVTAMSYDALGNLLSRTEAQGRPEQRTTSYRYDALGRQVRTVYPEVGVYNPLADNLTVNGATSLATRTETAQTLYTQTTYDALGNAVAGRDVAGSMSYKTYDKLGHVVYDVDAMGYVTGYTRSAFGDTTQLVRYGAATTLTSGNPASLSSTQVASTLAQAGVDHSADRTLLTEYDRLGRAVKVTEPQVFVFDSSVTTDTGPYIYNPAVQNDNRYFTAGKITKNTYSAFGDLTRVAVLKNPVTDTWTTTNHYYNQLGQQTASVDALGYLTTQAYDAVGNIVARTEYATAIAGWNGSAAPATAPTATVHADDRATLTTYDRADRKVSEVRVNVEYSEPTTLASSSVSLRGNLTTTYGYDAVGNLTRTTAANGAATYSYYDALGRVKAVATPTRNSTVSGANLTPLTVFRRDAYGNVVVKIDYANGAAAANETSYTAGAADAADRSELAQYDRLGHVTQTTDAGGFSHYKSYDALGHVAKDWQVVTGNDGVTKTLFKAYQYDKRGNQTHVIDPASTTVFQAGVSSSFTSSVRTYSFPSGYTLGGTNSVTLGWPEVVDASGGLVRVQIDYSTLSTFYDAGLDEYGAPVYTGLASHGATRTQDYTAAAAVSGTTMSWANVSAIDGGISKLNYVRVWQQDAAGNWIMKWEGSGAQTNGSGVIDVSQEQADVTDTAFEYNAFGELTRKGISGGRQEYFVYDNAGHLWRTNSGDGKDKVSLYDVQGHQTAQIESAGSGRGNVNLQAFTTADQVAALTDVRRTDMRYDALGRLLTQLMPERLDAQGGVSISRNYAQRSITSSATVSYDESSNPTWSGTNSVNLAWAPLTSLGSGDIKVVMDYSQAVGAATSRTQVVRGDLAASGITMSWVDAPFGSTGGLSSVNRLQVFKKDVTGNWVKVVDQSAFGYSGRVIEVAAPTDGATNIQLQVRPAGSSGDTGWVTQAGISFDDALRFDVSSLGAGSWEYRVFTTPADGLQRTTAAGTFTIAADQSVSKTATMDGDSRWVRPVVNQQFDRWGNVIQTNDVRSTSWLTTYRYNANNQMLEQTQPDVDGNTSGSSPVTRVYYDKMGNQVAVKDANGNVNGQLFDVAGQLVAERHADTGVVSYAYNAYNAFGDKVKKTDARGVANSYSYDMLGRLLQTAYGAVDVYTVNASNEALFVNNRAITETSTWDQAGRKLSQTNGNGETTRYTYDLRGNVLQTYFPLSGSARTVFDAQNRKINEVDANGVSNLWFYDYFGQLTGHVDLGNNRYRYTYDNARQLITQTNTVGLGQNKSYQYDAAGQLTRITDNALNQVSTYAYDFAGNHVQESTTQDGVVYQDNHLAYDALGRLRWVGDSSAYVNMEYDKVGNRTRIQTHVINSDTASDENRYFKYDAMNRQIVVDAADALGTLGTKGHAITYDANGNRTKDEYNGNKVTTGSTVVGRLVTGYVASGVDENGNPTGYTYVSGAAYYGTQPTVYSYSVTGYDESSNPVYGYVPISGYLGTPIDGPTYAQIQGQVAEQYSYDANNNLSTISRDGTLLETRNYDGANRVVRALANKDLAISERVNGVTRAWSDAKAKEYFDKLYDTDVSGTGAETRTNRYDANGRLLYATVKRTSGSAKYNLNYAKADGSANYDAAGNLLGYQLINYDGTAYTNTYSYTHVRRDAYMEGVVTGTSNVLQGGSTTNSYDVNNNLAAVTDSTKAANNRTFINDAGGRILQSTQNGNTQRQLVVNGEVLGRYGSYLNPDKPADSSGNPLFITGSSFNFGYTKISGSYPAANPGTKVVTAGETLASIAKSVYGDSTLWYLIADANGLGGDRDLRVGQTLTVPSRVTGARNNSNSFKPYNPGEVVGNTTPNLPSPPGLSQGCGGLAVIIQIAVTIAVRIATGSAGAGNLAGQVVGNLLGTQEGIDWKEVAMAEISQGIADGVSEGVDYTGSGDLSSWGNLAARAAVSNAVTQTVAVAVGVQESFNWTAVAASAVSSGVNSAMGEALPSNEVSSTWDPQYGKVAQDTLKGFVSGMTVNAMRGGRLTELQVATDAFGNALGDSWGESMKRAGTQESKLDATLQENQQRQATQAAAYDQLVQAFGQDNSGDRYSGVRVADAGGYVNDGVVSDAGGGLSGPGIGGRLADDGRPTVIGKNAQGGEVWSTGAETYPVVDPQLDVIDLPVVGTGLKPAVQGRDGLMYSLLGATAGTGASFGDMALGLARLGNNTLLQVGDLLTLGYNHDHPLMQQVWAEQRAVGSSIVNALANPVETTTDVIERVANRYDAAMALTSDYERSFGYGRLFNDVGQGAIGLGSGLRAAGQLGDMGLRSAAGAIDAFGAEVSSGIYGAVKPYATLRGELSADLLNANKVAAGYDGPWPSGTQVNFELKPPGTRYDMVMTQSQAAGLVRGEPWFGGFAATDRVRSQMSARYDYAITPDYKLDVSMAGTVETTSDQLVLRGGISPQTGSNGIKYPGGQEQVEFVFGKNLRLVGAPRLLPPK